jgi:hypothetical protein
MLYYFFVSRYVSIKQLIIKLIKDECFDYKF